MARPTAASTIAVYQRLLERLRSGLYRPGDRFLSARAIAQQFGISYQTAYRLLCRLSDEGRLEVREKSGAFVPGGPQPLRGVDLIFHPRAARPGSFGHRLLDTLTTSLTTEGIDHATRWDHQRCGLTPDRLPVMWEPTHALSRCLQQHRYGVLMNKRAPFGMSSLHIDSVSLDDFSGGACAAELLKAQTKSNRRGRYAVLAGPREDHRSLLRIDGFRSVLHAHVVYADNWFFEDGYRVAAGAVRYAADGLFCCNDRLAEAALAYCRDRELAAPRLVGFDNAPVAESLHLTTIAIPWQEMADHTVAMIRRRLRGDTSNASQQIISPRPLVRRSTLRSGS